MTDAELEQMALDEARADPHRMVKIGDAAPVPFSPVGDIWVSANAIAQLGLPRVREMVRYIYDGAFARHDARKGEG